MGRKVFLKLSTQSNIVNDSETWIHLGPVGVHPGLDVPDKLVTADEGQELGLELNAIML
jgi:hypothetical protein